MYSTDGITWTGTTSANDSNYWQDITFGGGYFVAVASSGSNKVMYSTDGINWTGAPSSNESNSWQSTAYGDGKYVAVSYSGTNRVMVLETSEGGPTGLFYDGALIATERNLEPVFEKLNNLSVFTSRGVTFLDSDPTRPQGGLDSFDSAAAVLTNPRDGQFWYNTATNILSIRDQW